MGWADHQGSWSKAQHLRAQLRKLIITMCLVAIVAIVVHLNIVGELHFVHYSLSILFILLGVTSITQFWGERKISNLVPSSDGQVCPWCKIVISEGDSEAKCPKCHRNSLLSG